MEKIKSNLRKIILSIVLVVMLITAPVLTLACKKDKTEDNNYNVIMTVASIPPVLAALNSIESGRPTYAWAERGKTYQGITSVDGFTAIEGLNTGANASTGLTSEIKTNTVNTIEQIIARNEKAHITLYCVDYNAFAAYAVAQQAGLDDGQFTIAMIEDGSKAYSELYTYYVEGQTSAEEATANYTSLVEDYAEVLNTIKEQKGISGYTDIVDDGAAWALASLDNFVYYVQDGTRAKLQLDANANIAGADLYDILLGNTNADVSAANIVYKSINEHVQGLSAEQKDKYLTLMFGSERAVTDSLFSRTKVGAVNVPTKKLVYIGGRVKEGMNYVAEMTDLSELTASYDDLDAKYKEVFTTAEDYALAYNIVNETNLPDAGKLAAINLYMDYTYQLKLIYMLYGQEYDILFKGHPRELVDGAWEDSRYTVGAGEDAVVYTNLEQTLVRAFYTQDSMGKFIGILPGGVAAENFAYLGYDFAIGGVSSSTYTGYDPTVIVEFIQTVNNITIQTENNVKARYAAGSLNWTKGEEENYTTLMLNQGQTYKVLAQYFAAHENAILAAKYQAEFKAWLIATSDDVTEDNVENYTIDRQGNIVLA